MVYFCTSILIISLFTRSIMPIPIISFTPLLSPPSFCSTPASSKTRSEFSHNWGVAFQKVRIILGLKGLKNKSTLALSYIL